jgi:hypothetical protein
MQFARLDVCIRQVNLISLLLKYSKFVNLGRIQAAAAATISSKEVGTDADILNRQLDTCVTFPKS